MDALSLSLVSVQQSSPNCTIQVTNTGLQQVGRQGIRTSGSRIDREIPNIQAYFLGPS